MMKIPRIYFFIFFLPLAQSLHPYPYNSTQIEVNGAGGGLDQGDVAWGNYDNDGDLDILTCGRPVGSNNGQLRIYRYDGAGLFTQIEVEGAVDLGFRNCAVLWGDYDGDDDLDILVSGRGPGTSNNRRVKIYENQGGPAYNFNTVEINLPAPANQGVRNGGLAWGDFDNDGDLDVLVNGNGTGGNKRLAIFINNGDATFNTTPLEPLGVNGGTQDGEVAWGDMDNDGDLDIVFSGADSGTNRRLRMLKNNGDGSFAAVALEVPAVATNGLDLSHLALADFDNDGFLDILASGRTSGSNNNGQLRIYTNDGDDTFTLNEVNGVNGGLRRGALAIGDADHDGDLDIVVSGQQNGNNSRDLWFYRNDGAPFPNFTQLEIDAPGSNHGMQLGGLDLADFDNDGDLDIVMNGRRQGGGANRELRVYLSSASLAAPLISAPNAPTTLVSTFTFSSTAVSTATFKWNPGVDTAPNPTITNWLNYDVTISTIAGAANPYVRPGLEATTPRLGTHPRPQRIYDGNTNHGVILRSTYPWLNQGNSAYGLRTDTTYYYNVRTIDGTREFSGDSATGLLWTGVAPEATTSLAAVTGTNPGEIDLSWNSAGDDEDKGNLTGQYRIQYSTDSGTVWNHLSTPPGAFTVDVGTTNVTPGSAQAYGLSSLTDGATYYFRLWSQDDVDLWSPLSNGATTWAQTGGVTPPGQITGWSAVTGTGPGEINLSWLAPGDDNYDPGTFAQSYDIRYSTTPALSPAISDGNFTAAFSVDPAFGTIPTPQVQGSGEAMALTGLLEGVTYYFAIKAQDEVPLLSPLSVGATTWAMVTVRTVDIVETLYTFGAVDVTLTTQTTAAVTINYSGNVNSTYAIEAATITVGSPWMLGGTAGSDILVLSAGLHPTQPGLGLFGAEDVLTTSPQSCTATKFSIDGTQTCVNMSPGTSRTIWFRIDMPTITSTQAEQQIQITIEASPP